MLEALIKEKSIWEMLFLAVYLVLIIPLLKKIGGRHSIMVIWSF
jgi:hypothetical protein